MLRNTTLFFSVVRQFLPSTSWQSIKVCCMFPDFFPFTCIVKLSSLSSSNSLCVINRLTSCIGWLYDGKHPVTLRYNVFSWSCSPISVNEGASPLGRISALYEYISAHSHISLCFPKWNADSYLCCLTMVGSHMVLSQLHTIRPAHCYKVCQGRKRE